MDPTDLLTLQKIESPPSGGDSIRANATAKFIQATAKQPEPLVPIAGSPGSSQESIYKALAAQNSDPKFIALSYQDQYSARTKVIQSYLSGDSSFLKLDAEGQKRVYNETLRSYAMPSLGDKKLEAYIAGVVAKGRKGDASALAILEGLANMNTMARASVNGAVTGKLYGAIGEGSALPDMTILPNGEVARGYGSLSGSSMAALMDGSDAAKLQVYFKYLAQDPDLSPIMKTAGKAELYSRTLDQAALSIVPGAKAATATGRVLAGAFVNAGVGAAANVAIENGIALLQNDPERYTDTVSEITKKAGEGAAVNFLAGAAFAGVFEYGIPAAKMLFKAAPKSELAPTGALWWKKAANPLEVVDAVERLGGPGEVPEALWRQLEPKTRDSAWLQSAKMQAVRADAATVDLRPIDATALASIDLPDIRWAPKNWQNPVDSGFNVWEYVPGKGGKAPLTMTGEAKSISELRGMLADKLYARFGMTAEPMSPISTIQAQDLLLEGRMRALSAQAYDPFAKLPTTRDFTSPAGRGYVSPTEAQDAAYAAVANGGQAYKVKIDVDTSIASRIVKQKSILDDASSLEIIPVDASEANAIAILNRPASGSVVQVANAWADKAASAAAGWTKAEARKFYLIHQGFDGVADAATGSFEAFFSSKVKWITDQFDAATGRLLPATQARLSQSGVVGNRIHLSSKIKASLGAKTLAANPEALATVAMAKFRGKLGSDDVGNFVEQLASAKRISSKGVKVEIAKGADNAIDGDIASSVSRAEDGSLIVRVPEKITTYSGQRKFVDSLLKDIDRLGADTVKPGESYKLLGSDKFTKAAEAAQSKYTLPFDDEAANAVWLDSVAQSQLGRSRLLRRPDGGYDLRGANGEVTQSFKDLYEARDSLSIASLDQKFLRGDLQRQGYALKGNTQDGFTLAGPGLSKPIYSSDLKGLLSSIDYKPSKISNRLAPSEVIIDRASTSLTFDGKALKASPKAIAKALSRFENPDELADMANITKSANGDVFKLDENYFRVDVPSLGMTKYFTNVDEAKAFLADDFTDISKLREVAASKGLSMHADASSGGFVLGDGANVYNAQSVQDVQKILRDMPDVSGGREILSALDPQADNAVKQILDTLDPEVLKKWRASGFNQSMMATTVDALDSTLSPATKGLYKPAAEGSKSTAPLRHAIRNNFSTWDYYAESTIRQELGMPDLAEGLYSYKRSYRAYETERSKWLDPLGSMMTDAKGKPYSAERLSAISAYKEAQGIPESLAKVKELYGDLSPREQWSLAQLSRFTDKAAVHFGIDPETYLKGYMSHIRDYALTHWDECSTMVDARELLTKSFGSWEKVPAKLKPYFKYERSEALLTAAMEHDPIKIFQRYVDQGLKEKYLQKPVQDILDYMKAKGDAIPADVQQSLLSRIAFTSGSGDVAGMEQATQLIEGVYKVFSKKALAPGKGAELFQSYLNTTYLGAIGFRSYSAARQFLQPMQMLAPRVGISPVLDAQRKVLGPGGKAIMERMRAEGTLLSAPPTTTAMEGGKLAKLTRKSMQMMWNTDDYARAVSAVFAEDSLERAVTLANKGKFTRNGQFDMRKFQKSAHLDDFGAGNPTGEGAELADKVSELALSGDSLKLKDAKMLYAQKVVAETNPDMSKFGQPPIYQNNVAGVLFGKFGTWSQTYRENIYRGWKNANGFAKKALFVTRFIGIQSVMHEGLTALGIRDTDMIPGSAALFGGGPAASQFIATIQAMGQGPQAKDATTQVLRLFSPIVPAKGSSLIDIGSVQAFSGLKFQIPKIVPGSLQAQYAQKFFTALDDYATTHESEDLWRAFLAATATPALK